MGKTQNVCAHTIQLNERQEKRTPKSMQGELGHCVQLLAELLSPSRLNLNSG